MNTPDKAEACRFVTVCARISAPLSATRARYVVNGTMPCWLVSKKGKFVFACLTEWEFYNDEGDYAKVVEQVRQKLANNVVGLLTESHNPITRTKPVEILPFIPLLTSAE